MIIAFIKIRFIQIYRGAKDLGLVRVLFLIGIILAILCSVFQGVNEGLNVMYLSLLCIFVIFFIHMNRQDKFFLKSHFVNYKWIYLSEYLILNLPFFVFYLYYALFLPMALLVFGIGVVINVKLSIKPRSFNTKFQQLIPADCYEWKAGIRKTLIYVGGIIVLGISTSFIQTLPIFIFILGVIPLSFYQKGEPYQMIIASEMSSRSFLLCKLKKDIFLTTFLLSPLIIVFMVFHYHIWYVLIAEYLIIISMHIYILFVKYAFYKENSKSPIVLLSFSFSVLIPFLIPVIWIMSIYFYYKSKKNLNYYLNDFNY